MPVCVRRSLGRLISTATAALCLGGAWAQPTPPISPRIQELPLPPAIELSGPPAPSVDLPDRPITAQEAAELALRHQPALDAAAAGVSAAAGRTQAARAGLGPAVSVGAGYTGVDGAGGAGGGSGFNLSATVLQLLHDRNHTRDLIRQAQAHELSAGAQLERVRADLVLAVKLTFYDWLQNVRLMRVAEGTVRNQEGHLALAQALLASGLGLPLDVVRAETAYAQGVYGLMVARNNALLARVSLAKLIGLDPRTALEPAEAGEPVLGSEEMEALVEQGLAQRPDVLAVQADVDAATAGLAAARTTNAPTVVGTVGVQDRGSSFPPDITGVSVGVAVQWTPLDAGLTAGRVREAEASLAAAQADLEAVRLAVIAEISQAWLDLQAAAPRITAAEAQVTNAQEALRLAEGRYRAGIGVFLDVLDAQTALDTARTNRVNAQAARVQARAALSHATGSAALPAPEQ